MAPVVILAALCGASPISPTPPAVTSTLPVDELGSYYEIPPASRAGLEFVVDGPGRLVLYLVTHRSLKKVEGAVMRVYVDGEPWRQLALGCANPDRSFCERRHRIVEVDEGAHTVTLTLGPVGAGASVHALFVAPDDLMFEPAIYGPLTKQNWQPVSSLPGQGGALDLVSIEELAPAESLTTPPRETPMLRAATNPVTFTVAGIGLTTTIVGLIFGVQSNSAFNTAAQPGTPQLTAQRLNGEGRRDGIVANTLIGVGLAGLITASVLFALDFVDDGGTHGDDVADDMADETDDDTADAPDNDTDNAAHGATRNDAPKAATARAVPTSAALGVTAW